MESIAGYTFLCIFSFSIPNNDQEPFFILSVCVLTQCKTNFAFIQNRSDGSYELHNYKKLLNMWASESNLLYFDYLLLRKKHIVSQISWHSSVKGQKLYELFGLPLNLLKRTGSLPLKSPWTFKSLIICSFLYSCYCVDPQGERIFGEQVYSASSLQNTMTCGM
jgi:hypothetical protein